MCHLTCKLLSVFMIFYYVFDSTTILHNYVNLDWLENQHLVSSSNGNCLKFALILSMDREDRDDPDETRMVYGDDFGFNEAGVATVLFQSPTANAGQHPGSPGRRWNNSFSKRSPTGKRRRLLPDRKCGHVGCFQFTKIEDGRCLVDDIQDEIQNLSLSNDQSEAEFGTWAAHLASYIGMDEP